MNKKHSQDNNLLNEIAVLSSNKDNNFKPPFYIKTLIYIFGAIVLAIILALTIIFLIIYYA